jgi:alpha-glucosidase
MYQIYPRSFQDADGNGVGDLRGIRQRLPYLSELGVDTIWISPIFPSPMADFGYDISDYTGIDPLFGSLEEFDALLAAAHEHGLKVLLDLVPNHTSDQHPWFQESRSSRQNARRDWYLWRDPAPDGGPPNNWLSNFGGGAWQWDERTASTIITPSWPHSPTSTGANRPSARRFTASCASGSGAGWTGSAWT